MRKTVVSALLLVSALMAASSARAANPDHAALVANFSQDLQFNSKDWDERAVLAAVLARPNEAAAFDAEARVALQDPKLRKLFTDKWRGKMAAFAQTESSTAGIDYSRTYANWAQIMSPAQRDFTLQREKTMPPDVLKDLTYGLKKLDQNLRDNGGQIGDPSFTDCCSYTSRAITGKILAGYKKDLVFYVNTPLAQNALRDAPAATRALSAALAARPLAAADVSQTATAPAAANQAPAARPVRPVAPASAPAAPETAGQVTSVSPTGGALEQARKAAELPQNGEQVFDGGVHAGPPDSGSAVVVPPSGGPRTARPTLSPSTKPTLTMNEPPSPGADAGSPADREFISQVESAGPGGKPLAAYTPLLSAGVGALLGGIVGAVLGFLVGGPIGAVIGAAAGAALVGGGAYLGLRNRF